MAGDPAGQRASGMESPSASGSNTTQRTPPTPAPVPPLQPRKQGVPPTGLVRTDHVHKWMASIEQNITEICTIATESKLNMDQKSKIQHYCRKITQETSHILIEYQAAKQKAMTNFVALEASLEKEEIAECLNELKECLKETPQPKQSTPSFADMVIKGSSNTLIRTNSLNAVAVYPADKNKTSDDTKELLQNLICPETLKLQLRGIRKIKNGGVIISADKKGDIEKLKETVKSFSSKLTIDEPRKRKPRIIVIGVPTAMAEKEVFECIFKQNLSDKMPTLTLEKFLLETKLSHKSGKKGLETTNYILEVSADIRKALIIQNRAYINWSSCPIRDFTLVTRCFQCQKYGHAAKFCREEKPTCGHCGELGHQIKTCGKQNDAPKCATCLHFKKPCQHKTGDLECPARKNAEVAYINSIDYGGT
ncbi:hypothetical protein NE865_02367 [Phthorimaea operculella]|nr:hypothetical protein NE865_02367 [Phthorimaea operculella]